VDHVPRARDDALLVGAEERERPAVGDADDPQDRSTGEDRREREARPAPDGLA